MYKIPATPYRIEETIKRSKFIATVAHACGQDDVKQFISSIKKEYPDASHHCWAYVAGPPGDTARIGLSDDGEPHGTAGKPILSVLLHSGIGEIAAVVTRYFGGTKLGTGGLVRAYSGAVKHALAGVVVKEKRDVICLSVTLNYSKMTAVKRMVASFKAEIIEKSYGPDVSLKIELPKTKEDRFTLAMTDLTRGEVLIVKESE